MTQQEQAYEEFVKSEKTFYFTNIDMWNAACKWQREQIQSYLIADNQGYFIGSSQYDEVFDK